MSSASDGRQCQHPSDEAGGFGRVEDGVPKTLESPAWPPGCGPLQSGQTFSGTRPGSPWEIFRDWMPCSLTETRPRQIDLLGD